MWYGERDMTRSNVKQSKGLSGVKEAVTVCRRSQEDCAVRTCLGANGFGEENGT